VIVSRRVVERLGLLSKKGSLELSADLYVGQEPELPGISQSRLWSRP